MEHEYTKIKSRRLFNQIINGKIEIPGDEHEYKIFAHNVVDKIYKNIKNELSEEDKDKLFMGLRGSKR